MRRPRGVQIFLLAYGVAACAIAVHALRADVPENGPLMPLRRVGIAGSLEVLSRGGPPLVTPAGQALPLADDTGPYLYLPLLGRVTGSNSPTGLVKLFFLLVMGALVLMYPLVFYEIFESVLAGIAAPLLVLAKFDFFQNTQLYFMPGWAVLFCAPLLMVVMKMRWRQPLGALALAATVLVGGFATSARNPAGLPILVSALVITVIRERRWARRSVLALVLCATYFAIPTIAVQGIEHVRDETVAVTGAGRESHIFWHSAYIGLGYIPNSYGITYRDEAAIRAAERTRHVEWLAPGYAAAMRHLFLGMVVHHPLFVLHNVVVKSAIELREALGRFWLALLLVPFAVAFARWRGFGRALAVACAPALAIGLVPPVFAVPQDTYALGWFGAWGFLWVVGCAWVAGFVERVLVSRLPQREALVRDVLRPAGARLGRSPWTVACAGGLVVWLVLGAGPAAQALRIAEGEFALVQNQTVLLPASAARGRPVAQWRFRGGVPAGWKRLDDTRIQGGGGARVTTDASLYGEQLWSPREVLHRGTYVVRLAGSVEDGAMTLGALDPTSQHWISVGNYTAHPLFDFPGLGPLTAYPGDRPHAVIATRFTLNRRTPVQIVLTNAGLEGKRSTWLIHRVALLRQPRATAVTQ